LRWITLTSLLFVVPIVLAAAALLWSVRDASATALREREGIHRIERLQAVVLPLMDARGRAAIDRAMAAVQRDERRRPLACVAWREAQRAWAASRNADDPRIYDALDHAMRCVSDASRLTYDAAVPGVDLADAVAYRMPGAVEMLGRANVLVARAHRRRTLTLDERLRMTALRVEAASLLNFAFADLDQAARIDPGVARAVGGDAADARRAAREVDAALASLARDPYPTPASFARAQRADGDAEARLVRLWRAMPPAAAGLLDQRLVFLRFRAELILWLAAALFLLSVGIGAAVDATQNTRQRAQVAALQHQAMHDHLTGLLNRRAMTEALEAMVEHPEKGRRHVLLFIDLDNFKQMNDTLGHAGGDEILKTIAARLCGFFREGDLVCRYGGDEFAVAVEIAGDSDLERRLEQLAASLREPMTVGGRDIYISASIGASEITREGISLSHALQEADHAMYAAKVLGRDRAVWHGKGVFVSRRDDQNVARDHLSGAR